MKKSPAGVLKEISGTLISGKVVDENGQPMAGVQCSGDPAKAKTLLVTVMSHAGAGPQELSGVANASTPEALQLEIVKEKLRNFVCENGLDWLALRRLPFPLMQQLNPNIRMHRI